jgi:hypothetical protein
VLCCLEYSKVMASVHLDSVSFVRLASTSSRRSLELLGLGARI